MVNIRDTYSPKYIWQHPFPLAIFISCIANSVDSHALTRKRSIRGRQG